MVFRAEIGSKDDRKHSLHYVESWLLKEPYALEPLSQTSPLMRQTVRYEQQSPTKVSYLPEEIIPRCPLFSLRRNASRGNLHSSWILVWRHWQTT
jgi:hypothetical protein